MTSNNSTPIVRNDLQRRMVIIDFTYSIPENSEEGFKEQVEQWFKREIPEVIERVMDDRFEEDIVEAFNDDFEPEAEELSDIGEFDMKIITVLDPESVIKTVQNKENSST